ncbi:MAG: ATP-binding cassette domain-containing protein [Henriciella sp.]
MYKLSAKNVSLVFPLYGNKPAPDQLPTNKKDSKQQRLIKNTSGAIIGVKALTEVNLDLSGGNRLGIMGANGSGKTTLLQVLAGILTPDAGTLTVRGHRSNLISIGLGLRPQATGRRNIFLSALAAGHSKDDILEKKADIESFSELGEFLEMPVSTYSAGMRMRLSFAIATAFDPQILILDEWLSAGDAQFKQLASKRMNNFVGSAGILVFASHNPALLKSNCNLGLWMKDGQPEALGAIDDVMAEYQKFNGT